MAFVKYDRASLPVRNQKASIYKNGVITFNQDFLLANDIDSWRFVAMYYDDVTSTIGFNKSDSINDLASFDFVRGSYHEAYARASEFIDSIPLTIDEINQYAISYDDTNLIYVLTLIISGIIPPGFSTKRIFLI